MSTNNFLRNAWYVAAWNDEVTQELMPRTLLNERVVLYRGEGGDPIAIGGVCPHRFAPLEFGRRIGDHVECGYHGLRFDRTGACVFNPHGNGPLPPAAKVKTYPVVERHHSIWIWMGDAALADADRIPDFTHLSDPMLNTIRGMKSMNANYMLLIDNLMDASHSQFVHASLLKTSAFLQSRPKVIQVGEAVEAKIWAVGGEVPLSYKTYLDPTVASVDMWVDFRWDAPAALQNRTGVTPTGHSREEGAEKRGTHFVTPETDTTTHYFYAHSRSFKQSDPDVDDAIRTWQKVAFFEQDTPMIEACQRVIGNVDMESLNPVLLASDAGVVRVRRTLKRLIAEENGMPAVPGRMHTCD